MEAQKHIIDETNGQSYWESSFSFVHSLPLTADQWFYISRTVEKMVDEIDYENRKIDPLKDF